MADESTVNKNLSTMSIWGLKNLEAAYTDILNKAPNVSLSQFWAENGPTHHARQNVRDELERRENDRRIDALQRLRNLGIPTDDGSCGTQSMDGQTLENLANAIDRIRQVARYDS